MGLFSNSHRAIFIFCVLFFCAGFSGAAARTRTRHFEFNIGYSNVTKNCKTTRIVAVNGQLPGPAIRIKQGDNVVVKVNNLVDSNITIHWHGVSQVLSGWQDGPAYITQCPIQKNNSFTYRFKVDQVGTLFWHAHISWLRGTVYGAFVIKPRTSYPFPTPYKEETLLLGDWYDNDLQAAQERAEREGRGMPAAHAYTINGKLGPSFNIQNSTLNFTCSAEDTHRIRFTQGKTHMLRIINAALEQNLFFSIANHTMTIVEADASYTKQLTVDKLMISPGQTYAVLVDATHTSGGRYYMAASPWRASNASFLRAASLGVVDYDVDGKDLVSSSRPSPVLHALPSVEDEISAEGLQTALRSRNSRDDPARVPQTVDRRLFLVVSFNWRPCSPGANCTKQVAGVSRNVALTSSINNVSFVAPKSTSVLEAYYNQVGGVYTTDFPDNPPTPYDYTGSTLPFDSLQAASGTRMSVIPYGANVQLVLQTPQNLIGNSTHPFHLHGFDFYVVGQGKGNFNATRDEPGFNLVDPPRRNTALMPRAGWVAVRFHANNPGAWLFHCHLEGHVSFAMEMVFIVENGKGPSQTLPPPPADLPKC